MNIKLIREDPEAVKRNLERRSDAENLRMFDELVDEDRAWRQLSTDLNELRHKRRKITNEIAALKRAGNDFEEQIEKGRRLDTRIVALEHQVEKHRQNVKSILVRLPNLLHESVPFGKNEDDNVQVKAWGKPPKFNFKAKNHLEIAEELGLIDGVRGAKVAGRGFFYLKDDLVLLDLALQHFAIHAMTKKGYRLVEPPFMMRRKPYEGVTDLQDFENVMFKVENEDLYMIATAEHPLAAMYMDEVLLKKDLPIKLTGLSPCFRKEVGTHGKYTKGLFRMHQFNKIEQFVFCLPENSWTLHEELQSNAEELYQALELHYEVVNVCTGEIGIMPAKRYDINVWMSDGLYREIGSNSNLTDYQARRLNIRYRNKEGQTPQGFVHTINNTAIATSRTMLAILEQHQQKDGSVLLPKILTKYAGGLTSLRPH